jgi:hypothetical protein
LADTVNWFLRCQIGTLKNHIFLGKAGFYREGIQRTQKEDLLSLRSLFFAVESGPRVVPPSENPCSSAYSGVAATRLYAVFIRGLNQPADYRRIFRPRKLMVEGLELRDS